jgi:hypothetical protein
VLIVAFPIAGLLPSKHHFPEVTHGNPGDNKAYGNAESYIKTKGDSGIADKSVAIIKPGNSEEENGGSSSPKKRQNQRFVDLSWQNWWKDPIAFFTFWIALLTTVLGFSTVALWCATRKSTKIAKDALTKLERPYVYVFDVERLANDIIEDFVPFKVGNYGKLPATIKEVLGTICLGIEPERPVKLGETDTCTSDLFYSPVLSPSEVRDNLGLVAPNTISFGAVSDEIWPQWEGDGEMFVRVVIKYHGPFTRDHETSACWIYHSGVNRLIPYGGDDFNYMK